MTLLFLLALAAGDARAGFAAADITPEPGAQMPGGFRPNYSQGVRDPLYAVAAVISDGATPIALVGIDALFIGKHTVGEARALIEKTAGIPGTNVLIGASHAHTGGPILDCLGSDEDPAYSARVAKAIARAVEDAWKVAEPCELAIVTGKEDTISFNRRFLMKDGREITHPGKPGTPFHDQIVKAAGPIDPEVGVLAARRPDGTVFGLVVNFACHTTVIGGTSYSADYIGFLRKHLKIRYGEATQVAFLNGASGDITQVDNLSPGSDFGPEHSEMMGRKLAAEAERALSRADWLPAVATAAAAERIRLAIRPESDVAREDPAFGLGSEPDDVFAAEREKVAAARQAAPEIDTEVQGLRIGPLGIATTGAEYFCDYGLRIKAASPHRPTWVVAYANDYLGYVATANAMAAGGYECRTARSSQLSWDSGQRIVEACLRVLGRVRPAEPIRLFNGKDLSGWTVWLDKRQQGEDPGQVFSVVDGAIRASGKEFGYLMTDRDHQDYRLTLEFSWGKETHPPRLENARDAGILYHMEGPDKIWPRSLEFQIIEGGTGDVLFVGGASAGHDPSLIPRFAGSPADMLSPDGKRVVRGRINWPRRSPEWKDVVGFRGKDDLEKPTGEWNLLELVCDHGTALYRVNGVEVARLSGLEPSRGRILLQSEGAEIYYRNVELTPVR
jgi:hypothetical protein